MHTDRQQKRRTLLLLVLLLSTVLLFDALMIFNRQEPQTYQSKASTIEEPLPTDQEIAALYASVPEFLDDVELSREEGNTVISLLQNQINTDMASASAYLDTVIRNAQSVQDPSGVMKLTPNIADVNRYLIAKNQVMIDLKGTDETIMYVASDIGTTSSDQKKINDYFKKVQELINQNTSRLDENGLNQLLEDIDALTTENVDYNPSDQNTKDNLATLLNLLYQKRGVVSHRIDLKKQDKKAKEEIGIAPPVESKKEKKTDTTTEKNNEIESAQPALGGLICLGTNMNDSGGTLTCNRVPVGSVCESNQSSGSEDTQIKKIADITARIKANGPNRYDLERLKQLQKHTCVLNEKETKEKSTIICDCKRKESKLEKIVKSPYRLANKNWFTRLVAGAILGIVEESIRTGDIPGVTISGGDEGGGGNPTGWH